MFYSTNFEQTPQPVFQMEFNKCVHTNFPVPHWCPGTGAEKKTKGLCLKAAEASQQTL